MSLSLYSHALAFERVRYMQRIDNNLAMARLAGKPGAETSSSGLRRLRLLKALTAPCACFIVDLIIIYLNFGPV